MSREPGVSGEPGRSGGTAAGTVPGAGTFFVRTVEEPPEAAEGPEQDADPRPAGSGAGLQADVPRVLWILHGDREGRIPACQVELWWYDELADRWVHQGGRRAITDGALVEQVTYGGRVAIRLHDPRGRWKVHCRLLP